MKISLLLLFFYSYGAALSNPCKSYNQDSGWTCVGNQDKTVNITMDCSLVLDHKYSAELWIWSSDFPEEMKSLTIQNCHELTLNTSCNLDRDVTNFQYLQIKNTSTLNFKEKKQQTEIPSFRVYTRRPYSSWRVYDEDFTIKPRNLIPSMLPTYTTFENIPKATFSSPLVSSDFKEKCYKKNYLFKSLRLINVTMDTVKENFIGYSFNMTNFLMDNVEIQELGTGTIFVINSTNATVKIINSKFPDISQLVMDTVASEVTFKGNSFKSMKHVDRFRDPKSAFKISSEKFTFTENKIYSFSECLEVRSSFINISNNTFQQLTDYAFNLIHRKNATDDSKNRYIFSRNIIRTLNRESFGSESYRNPQTDFDSFNIFDNFIDCSCETILWFDFMARHESQTSRKQFLKWFNLKNNNRCSNLPNCTLNQVLYNVEELCEENYTCPDTDIPYNSKHSASVLKDMLESLNDIADSNLNLLNALTNQKALGKIQINSYKGTEDSSSAKYVQNVYYQKEIYTCLVLISCLSFIAFCYCVFLTYQKYLNSKKITGRDGSQTELVFSHGMPE